MVFFQLLRQYGNWEYSQNYLQFTFNALLKSKLTVSIKVFKVNVQSNSVNGN